MGSLVALVQMGPTEDDLSFGREVGDDWVILVPAGRWHSVTNIGNDLLKIYAIHGPPRTALSPARCRSWSCQMFA